MFLRADSGGKVIRLKHWNKIKPWEFVLVQIGTIRSRNTKTRKNLEERAANWEQAERFDRIQLCFPLLYVSLGWDIHSVFCSSFRNTDNMFWFMDSFFAYFNYLLINLSALVAADTHDATGCEEAPADYYYFLSKKILSEGKNCVFPLVSSPLL